MPAGGALKAVPVALLLLAVGKGAGTVGSTFGSLLTVLGAGISIEIGSEAGPGGPATEVASIGTASVPGEGKAACLASFFAKRFGGGWGSARAAVGDGAGGGSAAMVRVEKACAEARVGGPVTPSRLGEASKTSTCTANTNAVKPASQRQRIKPDEWVEMCSLCVPISMSMLNSIKVSILAAST